MATIDDQIFKGNRLIPSRSNNLLNLASPFKKQTDILIDKPKNLLTDTNAYKHHFFNTNQTPEAKNYIKEVIKTDNRYIHLKQEYMID